MTAEMNATLVSGLALLLFVGVFLAGGRVHPLRLFTPSKRSALSFGAGISMAYVFVHVLPELHDARMDVVKAVGDGPLPFEGRVIYFLSMLGFLAFYGLDHLRNRLRDGDEEGRENASFRLHLAGFSAYVALLSYLLVRDPFETTLLIAIYAFTIAVHLLGVDHSLRLEHGAAYERTGRFVLAGMAVLGWVVGLLVALSPLVTAALVAVISGAIIVNSAIMELPPEKDGRFLPFMAGGLIYGGVLMLL